MYNLHVGGIDGFTLITPGGFTLSRAYFNYVVTGYYDRHLSPIGSYYYPEEPYGSLRPAITLKNKETATTKDVSFGAPGTINNPYVID